MTEPEVTDAQFDMWLDKITEPVGRLWRGDEDQCDAFEARETKLRMGAHHDGGTGDNDDHWPIWSKSSREQNGLLTGLAARDWLNAHGEDTYDYDGLYDGHYPEDDE